jgi:ribose/xylose/arabinose/galactoside ABC-type transport system permease subunit
MSTSTPVEPQTDPGVDARPSSLSWLSSTNAQKLLINIVALVVIGLVFASLSDRFLTTANATNVLRQVAPVIIIGAAVTPLMVSRGLDLSVGGVVALSGVTAALVADDLPLPAAFGVGILAGSAVGVVNAVVAVQFGVNSVIATLGTMYVATGTANLLSDGVPIYEVPDDYDRFGNSFIGGIPTPVWVMLVILTLFIWLERKTLLGRYATAVGSNPEAAFLSGIPAKRTEMALYVLSGTMAGLAGVLISSRLASGLPNVGAGYEFQVIVATVLGGTSLAGGEGTVLGMAIGALIIGVLGNGLNLLGVPSFWQTVTQGVVLVLAVALDVALRKRLRGQAGGIGGMFGRFVVLGRQRR